ncbi:hypothetical protein [Proteiniborus sp. MB09-C3]|uniref:hypothetical protein n=1 Tax=Proteiniborus sp. MB09-C3 TaxID=3050072 RepID=UPI0025564646|nr:hypothetical protein [Proteiniborus sp. MB09-C3]WIV11512.1 hypothetical protein QO263_15630 [Proteiniborus sp. MB09-C3]
MRKSIKTVLMLAAAFVIFSFGFSATTYAEAPFEVKANIGFNGFFKYEYVTPVNIEVKNNQKDVNGKIQILFENIVSSGKKLYTAYTKDLDIAKGATKTINMELKLDRQVSEYKIRILDSNDKLIWEDQSVAMPIAKASNTVGIGVLSDEFESLWYLPLMTFQNSDEKSGNRTSSMCDLDGQIPTDTRYLNMLDVILINNYNTEKLTSEEKEALIKWVDNGGVLLIGTGPNYNKTLKGLGDINYIEVSGTTAITKFDNIKDSSGNAFMPSSPLSIVDAISSSGNVILKEGNLPIIFSESKGNGNVVISTFDLGLSPFIDWSGKDKFLERILTSDVSETHSEDILTSNNSPYRFFDINQYIPSSKAPSVKVIIAVLMIFTVIVGPINYLVLKRLDKREMAWITIPALAVLFSVVVLIWGSGTSFKNPLMNNVSVININNGADSYDINTFAGVISFKNGDVNISSSEDTDIFPNSRYSNDDYMKYGDNDIILEYILQKNRAISFKKKGVWDVQQITLKETKKLDNGISQELKLKDNTISGEIKNNSNIELKDAILFYGLNFHKLGDIKIGESKSISFNLNTSSTINQGAAVYRRDMYQVIESIYPWNSGPGNINNQDVILSQDIKRDMLEGLFQYINVDNNNDGAFIIAWNTDKLSSDITVNEKVVERIDRNIILMPINMNYEKGEVVEIPYGILSPKILELNGLNYDAYDRGFYGQGSTVMSIKSDEKIDFDELNINLAYGNISSSNKIWIFNYATSQWDEYTSFTILIDNNNKNTYYDEIYGTKLKIEVDGRDRIWMPTFSIKGVAK